MDHPSDAPNAPALEVRGIVRTYRGARGAPARRALDGLSLSVGAGEWVALLGPNGSGKSTLVRVLATLDRPDGGEVLALGRTLGHGGALGVYRRALGVVFQHPGLDKLLTVGENLGAQAALHGISGGARRAAIARVARLLQIEDRLGERVGRLSGGLARRCDLARALLPDPSLLILDEATVGLDHDARVGFMDLLASLRGRAEGRGAMTILMTTHLMDEAECADRVVMMHQGRVVLDGAPADLRARVGGLTIRCPASSDSAAHILGAAGLDARTQGAQRVARIDEARSGAIVPSVAARLAEAGVPFEISPPTLGDAYLAATGASLELAPVEGEAA